MARDDNSKARRGIKARNDALTTLISRHQDEFEELHAKNRVAAGLSPRPAGPSREDLQARRDRLRAQLEKTDRELQFIS